MSVDLETIAFLILWMTTGTAAVAIVGLVYMVVGLARLSRPARHNGARRACR